MKFTTPSLWTAFACLTSLLCVSALTGQGTGVPTLVGVLQGVDKAIAKEPKFLATPRYSLLVFGAKAESRV